MASSWRSRMAWCIAGVEHREARLAAGLRHVHRHVGVAHHVGGPVDGIAGPGDADAGRDAHGLPADGVRRAELAGQPLCHAAGPAEVGEILGEHRELVATETRHEVSLANQAADPLRDGHEQLVAGGMAKGVVHDLEVVDVDEQHRGDRLAGRSPATAMTRSRVSWNERRLATPVSASCSARSWTRRSSTELRRFSAAMPAAWATTLMTRRSTPGRPARMLQHEGADRAAVGHHRGHDDAPALGHAARPAPGWSRRRADGPRSETGPAMLAPGTGQRRPRRARPRPAAQGCRGRPSRRPRRRERGLAETRTGPRALRARTMPG